MNLLSLAEEIESMAIALAKTGVSDDISDWAFSIKSRAFLGSNRLLMQNGGMVIPVNVKNRKTGEIQDDSKLVWPRIPALECALKTVGNALQTLADCRSKPRYEPNMICPRGVRRPKGTEPSAVLIAHDLRDCAVVLKDTLNAQQNLKASKVAKASTTVGVLPSPKGERSRPMSRIDIARCYLGRRDVRTREAALWMKSVDLQPVKGSPRHFTIRLDEIPDQSMRGRFR